RRTQRVLRRRHDEHRLELRRRPLSLSYPRSSVSGMTTEITIALVVEDMARSLAFYRRLGLDLPADADVEPHVEVALADGIRLAWDTTATIRSFDPDWTPPTGSPKVSLAFKCADAAEVDLRYAELIDA